MMEIILALDMGGTYVKAALLDGQGRMLPGTQGNFPARAKESREVLLRHLHGIMAGMLERAPAGAALGGVGFSFPGPFDYEAGVCLIRGLNKYDALYGLCLRDALHRRIQAEGLPIPVRAGLPILFENDAALFALGEWAMEPGAHGRRISVTLGTGVGSAFIEEGRLVKQDPGVPPNGWIYAAPCRESIIDEQLSARGLVRLANERGLSIAEPLELARLAQAGDAAALDCFAEYGLRLGDALRPFARGFRAEEVVLGGQMAKSGAYFLPKVQAGLPGVCCRESRGTSASVFAGVYQLLRNHQEEQA